MAGDCSGSLVACGAVVGEVNCAASNVQTSMEAVL